MPPYAAGQAGVAAHELGAAAYAIKAARAGAPEGDGAGRRECRWQRDQLPDAIRELVLDDQRLRTKSAGRCLTAERRPGEASTAEEPIGYVVILPGSPSGSATNRSKRHRCICTPTSRSRNERLPAPRRWTASPAAIARATRSSLSSGPAFVSARASVGSWVLSVHGRRFECPGGRVPAGGLGARAAF